VLETYLNPYKRSITSSTLTVMGWALVIAGVMVTALALRGMTGGKPTAAEVPDGIGIVLSGLLFWGLGKVVGLLARIEQHLGLGCIENKTCISEETITSRRLQSKVDTQQTSTTVNAVRSLYSRSKTP
jgi:hypothetical protein